MALYHLPATTFPEAAARQEIYLGFDGRDFGGARRWRWVRVLWIYSQKEVDGFAHLVMPEKSYCA